MKGLRFRNIDEMPESMRKLMQKKVAEAPAQPGSNQRKYRNAPTVVDGIRFDSKREANYYASLKARVSAGEVAYFLRQVPIHLPSGTRYVVDFQIHFADHSRRPEYVDVKGFQTKEFKIKLRAVQFHYPITITLV